MSRSRDTTRSPAVLVVSPFSCEWWGGCVGDAPIRIDVPESRADLLAKAVEEAWRAAGSGPRECVLAVGRPYAQQKLLALPPMSRADLAAVFERRARALAGDEALEPRAFVARLLGARAEVEGAAPRWLLAVLAEGVLRDVRIGLRERGFRVLRLVSTELAAIECARQRAPDPQQATLAIAVHEGSVTVSLLDDTNLVHQDTIEGDLSQRPALAASLVHEVRTCAGIWRKESRGKSIGQVVVLGLSRERVDLLRLSISPVLPEASVLAASTEHDPDGRIGLLEALRVQGPLNLELTSWIPPRRRFATLVGSLAAAVMLGGSALVFDAGSERMHDLREETSALLRTTDELALLRTENQQVRGDLERLQRLLERARQIERRGIDIERMLESVARAFGERAELREMSVRPRSDDGMARLVLEGACPAEPAQLVGRLREVLDELERDSGLHDLRLSLPEDLSQATAEASFRIEARLNGGGA